MNEDEKTTKDLLRQIKGLELKIIDLENEVMMERMVKNSEVALNRDMKERIEKCELHNETLGKIIEQYIHTVARLRIRLKDLILK
mgnify:CR=1 FL=1|jgi:hypothetical protein|tara:strand:- start:1476 stop:1730 length:255 start_codon:yes stop_codon:yes gene_type:complete